jgi:hypothetical protein
MESEQLSIVGYCRICKKCLHYDISGDRFNGTGWVRRGGSIVCTHHAGVAEWAGLTWLSDRVKDSVKQK